jgi:hypothetical protein
MSIIRETYLTLVSVITESNVIVEVEFTGPFEEEMPVVLKDESLTVPPFTKRGLIFRVKNVIKNTHKDPVDTFVRIPAENWKRSFSQHVELHANGPSKSYRVKTYKTTVPSFPEAAILFLHRFHNSYELTAKGSYESTASRRVIEKLIKEQSVKK